MGMLAEVRNGAAEEDWRWDLNPGAAAIWGLFWTTRLGQRSTDFYFSEIRYLGLGRGGRKDCAFVGIVKDFGISMKTFSHYS